MASFQTNYDLFMVSPGRFIYGIIIAVKAEAIMASIVSFTRIVATVVRATGEGIPLETMNHI